MTFCGSSEHQSVGGAREKGWFLYGDWEKPVYNNYNQNIITITNCEATHRDSNFYKQNAKVRYHHHLPFRCGLPTARDHY